MSQFDDLYQAQDDLFHTWNLREIPFAESAEKLQQLEEVFTGRQQELSQIITLLRGRDSKSILVYGWIGIGKTAFIQTVLKGIERHEPDSLVSSIRLVSQTDLVTLAFIALARKMPDDAIAQAQLSQILQTIDTDGVISHRLRFPDLCFESLLDRVLQTKRRVIIAIDDLDKQDPAMARQLLLNAQGLLKGKAWFILTGHPSGITRDYLIADRGIFDLTLQITQMDQQTSYEMLKNYLKSARFQAVESQDETALTHPFTPETAWQLCEIAEGVPRRLNRMASYILRKAIDLKAALINPDILAQGLDYAREQLRGQKGLTAQDYYVLDVVLNKGTLSDANVTLEELERMQVREFAEIMPVLDKLVSFDLIHRLPTARAAEYCAITLLQSSGSSNFSQQGSRDNFGGDLVQGSKFVVTVKPQATAQDPEFNEQT